MTPPAHMLAGHAKAAKGLTSCACSTSVAECWRTLSTTVHGGAAPEGGLALAGDQQRVHERLRVVPPDADQQAVDQAAHHRLRGVDARNHLRCSGASMRCT